MRWMEIFGENGSNFWFIMKFEGEAKFCQILNPKIVHMWTPFLHKFVTLKELTAERLIDSSWNMLENIKRPHGRDFLHLKHFWI